MGEFGSSKRMPTGRGTRSSCGSRRLKSTGESVASKRLRMETWMEIAIGFGLIAPLLSASCWAVPKICRTWTCPTGLRDTHAAVRSTPPRRDRLRRGPPALVYRRAVPSRVRVRVSRMLIIDIEEIRHIEFFEATLDGRVLCRSRQPLLASARVLLAEGVAPETVIGMRRLGCRTIDMTGILGACAKLTVY